MTVLLNVENLRTYFRTHRGLVKAVDGVSFHVNDGEILAIVGESGCGKSVTQLSVLQLISKPPGEIISGKVIFEDQDLLKFPPKGPEMRRIRGSKIAMIFQEPMTSLNPTLTICRQMTEMLELHLDMNAKTARSRAIELLDMVGIPEASSRVDDYPHQLSGGMRQRVMIAMAMSCHPKILIADEPTTAIDVTTQAQILELLKSMGEKFNTSLIIVTHNLGVVARYAQRIYVMYAGRIIESGKSRDIFYTPRHPYTKSLLSCVPRLDLKPDQRLEPIEGTPPVPINLPSTCAFMPRCHYKNDMCKQENSHNLRQIGDQHYTACCMDL